MSSRGALSTHRTGRAGIDKGRKFFSGMRPPLPDFWLRPWFYLCFLYAFIDGKYVYLRKPDNAGSEFYCHKMRHASTLLALVDSNYKFLYADFGAFGSNHDAYVFNSSSLCDELENETLNLPQPCLLPESDKVFGYYIVADDAFALRKYLIKPIKKVDRELTDQENETNYR